MVGQSTAVGVTQYGQATTAAKATATAKATHEAAYASEEKGTVCGACWTSTPQQGREGHVFKL
jgi:hypothetical protein